MPNMIGIKHLESLYVVQKRKKFNIAAIAITTDGRKLASSMYATVGDIKRLYAAYDANNEEIDTSISTGIFKLLKYNIPSKEYGLVPMYNVEIGEFKCMMPPSAYEQFIITLNTAFKNITESSLPTFSIRAFGRKKNKKKKGIFE